MVVFKLKNVYIGYILLLKVLNYTEVFNTNAKLFIDLIDVYMFERLKLSKFITKYNKTITKIFYSPWKRIQRVK